MPKTRRTTRRPAKRERIAGLTVTVQRTKKSGYAAAVVMRQDGQRIRERYLATMGEAQALAQQWAIEAGNTGAQAAATITDADKRFLMEARQKLAAFQKTPADAVAFYLAHLERCKASITVADLADRLVRAKTRERKSKRYLDDLRWRLGRFCCAFGDRLAADVTTEELSTWLAGLDVSPVSVGNFRRVVSVLFSYGVTLRACVENPATGAHNPKAVESEVGILSVSQAARLLEAARQIPEMLPAVALGLFAGVRDAELLRLDWTDVNFESGYVEIRASKAKSARRRLISIRPALRAWLEPLRALSGPIWPNQARRGRRLMEEVRRAAGFSSSKGSVGDSTVAEGTLNPWPHNAMRHSFASYALAAGQDAPALALELGHTTPHIVFAHYREIVLPREAEGYWNLFPTATLEPVPIIALNDKRAQAQALNAAG